MEEKKTMCPLLGSDCVGESFAWCGDETYMNGSVECAMYSIASSLSNLDTKAIDADEFLQVVERIAE